MTAPGPAGARGQRQGSVSARELRGDTRSRRRSAWGGVAFLAVVVAVIVGLAVVVLRPIYADFAFDLARDNPQALRLPFVPDIVRDRLGGALREPMSDQEQEITFVVQPGQSITQTGQGLTDAGLIRDPLAFSYHVVTRGLDDELQTGSFVLSPAMTPLQIAQRLAEPPDPARPKVVLAFRQGLRLEQMAAYLQSMTGKGLDMDVSRFYQLTLQPPDALRERFPFLREIPKGRSLEGFMGHGVFEVDTDITPEELLQVLLEQRGEELGEDLIAAAKEAGRTFYEVMTVASLVERETGVDAERDKVAGVYLNRLDPGLNPTQILNADPTVIYAVDTIKLRDRALTTWPRYAFWTTVDQALARVRVPDDLESYQTYVNPGLPDGPIASASLPSIRAVLEADTKGDFLYFYACPGSRTHVFAKTLAQQEANIRKCGSGS
jgi:UPF0755 protein